MSVITTTTSPFSPGHTAAMPYAREAGSAYGHMFLDISKYRPGNWQFYRSGHVAGFTRQFMHPSLRVSYAFAGHRHANDIDTEIDRAVRADGPGQHPTILKLYAMPDPGNKLKLHRRTLDIGGRKYVVLPRRFMLKDRIHLGHDYESFLSTLGRHSRRNMRLVRRQATQNGITHAMERADRRARPALNPLIASTHPEGGMRPGIVAAMHRLLGEHDRGFHSILRLPTGEVLSCCSGFIEGETAFIMHQMNHRDHLRHNPSLTNRAFLLEHLIGAGVKDVVFIKGCRGVLQNALGQESAVSIWVIRRSPASLMSGLLLFTQFPLLEIPGKIGAFAAHLFGSKKDRPAI